MMQISSDRLQTFDRKVMGASFAISSLSGLASMSGGKLGEMSGTISKVTGALFALQAVTSLLTQSKLLELAQSRIGAASTAMKMAKGTQGGGMVGVAGKAGVKGSASIMGSLARVGLGLTKFLGPIGIATTAAKTEMHRVVLTIRVTYSVSFSFVSGCGFFVIHKYPKCDFEISPYGAVLELPFCSKSQTQCPAVPSASVWQLQLSY
jgi:hypothetical protein